LRRFKRNRKAKKKATFKNVTKASSGNAIFLPKYSKQNNLTTSEQSDDPTKFRSSTTSIISNCTINQNNSTESTITNSLDNINNQVQQEKDYSIDSPQLDSLIEKLVNVTLPIFLDHPNKFEFLDALLDKISKK
jgi:hypothetical protein